MRETHAFAIVKELKAKGHSVVIEDQPKAGRPEAYIREDDVAITGPKGMTAEAVKACTDHIRTALCRHSSPYTIETTKDTKRMFPNAAFAAW